MKLAKETSKAIAIRNLTEVKKYYIIINELDKVKEIDDIILKILKL